MKYSLSEQEPPNKSSRVVLTANTQYQSVNVLQEIVTTLEDGRAT